MATASDPAPVKQMEALLECSICMETLNEPRTLPCFHSFCKHCLTNFVATQKEAVKKEVFECPVCRTKFYVKEGESVEKMPSNHFVNNMLELLNLTRQAQSIKCQSCRARNPAASKCVSCEKYLCEKCLGVHNNWPDFEDHIVLTLEELTRPENRAKARDKPRCEKHNELFLFYCETCKVLVCRYCADVNHPRSEHLCFHLADVVVQHKEALKASCAIFEQQTNEAVQSSLKIEHAMANLKNNAAKAKDAIRQKQQEILNIFTKKLEQETTVLLDQVDMKYKEAFKPLIKQQSDVKDYLEKTKGSLDFVKNIISSGSDEEILSFKQEVEEKAGSIENERPESMEPVHNGSIDYQATRCKKVLENVKLNNLGKIVCPLSKQEEILNTKQQVVVEKAGGIEKKRSEFMQPAHNRSINYQATRSKTVQQNVKSNNLGKIVSPLAKEAVLLKDEQPVKAAIQYLCERSKILNGDVNLATQLADWLKDKMAGRWKLCYRATDDGWKGQDFHRKCNDAGPTVTLVKCGIGVFGGYTDQSWKPNPFFGMGKKHSETSFLFSLRNKGNIPPFKCPIYDNQENCAIWCDSSHGATFGGGYDLFISDNANRNKESYSNLGDTYQPPPGYQHGTLGAKSLLAGREKFTPTEIEVFSN